MTADWKILYFTAAAWTTFVWLLHAMNRPWVLSKQPHEVTAQSRWSWFLLFFGFFVNAVGLFIVAAGEGFLIPPLQNTNDILYLTTALANAFYGASFTALVSGQFMATLFAWTAGLVAAVPIWFATSVFAQLLSVHDETPAWFILFGSLVLASIVVNIFINGENSFWLLVWKLVASVWLFLLILWWILDQPGTAVYESKLATAISFLCYAVTSTIFFGVFHTCTSNNWIRHLMSDFSLKGLHGWKQKQK